MTLDTRTSESGSQRCEAAKAAGRQVHRQRMGAVMGPTIVRQRFQLDTAGSASVELVRTMMKNLLKLGQKVLPFTLDSTGAEAHIAAYKTWLDLFLTSLGYQDSSGYLGLHILRKHIIAQTILATSKTKPSNASEAEKCLQSFDSSKWFGKLATMKRLADLVPDQGEYLQTVGSIIRPWGLAPHGTWADETDDTE